MIWLLGRNGMLGRIVEQELCAAGLTYSATGRECDITDEESITDHARQASWIINCTGYTAVDLAEGEPQAAQSVNCLGVGNLARHSRSTGARVLHISTDYVFDGSQSDGYRETDTTGPINEYGRSKTEGEQLLRELLEDHVIIRTSWLYAEHGRNFPLSILRLLQSQGDIRVVNDQHGSPTYARDLARAIVTIVGHSHPTFGTFHFANEGTVTWFDFACEIQRLAMTLGILPTSHEIQGIPSREYPTAAARPRYSILDCSRIRNRYKLDLRAWQTALLECLERIAKANESLGSTLHTVPNTSDQRRTI